LSQAVGRLEPLFSPRSIALVGASNDPGKWGFIVLLNLINGRFPGKIYAVNPRQKEILGLQVYHSVAELPETPDLAVILVPPSSILQVIQDCLDKGIRAGVVITAGFAEVGDRGQQMERDMVRLARQGGMVLVGPNCNGIMSTYSRFYCSMLPLYPRRGSLAIISQSGNVAGSVTGEAISRGLGISRYISSGNEADLHIEDFLEYLEQDEQTKVILSYVEGLRDGRRFLEVARRVTKKKPILMLKAGDTPAGTRAARSHTAALAGSDSIFSAACKQAAIIRVHDVDEMVDAGGVFLSQPLPKGNRVGIITRGGGWGVLAADVCARAGLEVAPLGEKTLSELDKYLPPWWTRDNPVDSVAALGANDNNILEVLLCSAEIDGVVILGLATGASIFSNLSSMKSKDDFILAAVEDFCQSLREVIKLRDHYQKPVVVAMNMPLGGEEAAAKLAALTRETQTVCYTTPHQAAAAYAVLARYAQYLRYGSDA